MNNQNSSRKRRTVAFTPERLPSLDVSFPSTGRKFPFPYRGVCLLLAAGQSGSGKHGKKRGKRKMAANLATRKRSVTRKNGRLKEFKYTLEINTACTRTLEFASFSFPPFFADSSCKRSNCGVRERGGHETVRSP